jgi:hypothetical protein
MHPVSWNVNLDFVGGAMLKKLMSTKRIVLIFSIALIASCGGGGGSSSGGGGSCGGGADCVSFAFDGGASTVRTETFDPMPPTEYDPYITSSYASGSNLTSITAKYGYNSFGGYDETLYISFFGNTTGPYSVSLGSITYTSASPLASYTSTGTGEINVSTYEGTGGHIQGSFDVTVCTVATNPCPNESTKQMTGTFYVTRLFL